MNDSKLQELQDILSNIDKLTKDEIDNINQTYDNDFKEASKAKKVYDDKVAEIKKDQALTRYEYPFIIHMAGNNIEIDHIFENGKKYTEEEIRKAMLEHRFYEFAGKVAFEYLKKENVLLPIFQQHKKG